jgi:hypothetical protein
MSFWGNLSVLGGVFGAVIGFLIMAIAVFVLILPYWISSRKSHSSIQKHADSSSELSQ